CLERHWSRVGSANRGKIAALMGCRQRSQENTMATIRPLVLIVVSLLIDGSSHSAPTELASAMEVAEGHVSVRFVNTPLETAVEQVARSVGAQVEWLGAIGQTIVSTELANVSIAEALERVIRPHSYFVVTDGRTGAVCRIVVMPGGDTIR